MSIAPKTALRSEESVGTESSQSALAAAVLVQHRRVLHRRYILVLSGLSIMVFALFAVNVFLGSFTVTIPDFFAMLFGENIPGASFIVMETKLPRAILGLLVGAAFGASGMLFRSVLRNPLASPDIIGVSSGASASAVTAIMLFGASGAIVSFVAVIGGLAVVLLISVLSRSPSGRRDTGGRFILIGIAVAAVAQGLTVFFMQRSETYLAQEALVWLTGSLNSANWQRVTALSIAWLLLLPLVLWLAPKLIPLQLGDDTASGLGVSVGRSRVGILLLAVLLIALGTAAAGPIAFVAFLAGPIARGLLGGRTSVAAAALAGAAIVLAADYTAAYLLPTGSIPVGVVTGAIGAPFLLWLLLVNGTKGRQNKHG